MRALLPGGRGVDAEVLGAPLAPAAIGLDPILRAASPLSMVTAVTLAEAVLDGATRARRSSRQRSGG